MRTSSRLVTFTFSEDADHCPAAGRVAVDGLKATCVQQLFGGSSAAAGERCNDGRFTCTLLRRQDSSLSVEMTWPADSAVSLVDAVQSGAVSGVPPTAAVRVVNPATGAAVPEAAPAPIAASAYYRTQTLASNVECPDPAQMKSKLTAAGLRLSADSTVSTLCTTSRSTGRVTITIAPTTGVDAASAGAAAATALSSCVRVFDAAGVVLVPSACPPPSVPVVPTPPAVPGAPAAPAVKKTSSSSSKGLLGLLGLLGIVPLVACLALIVTLCLRRRKRSSEVLFAVHDLGNASPPVVPFHHGEAIVESADPFAPSMSVMQVDV